MITLRGIFQDGKVVFLDPVPFYGEVNVIITFLNKDLAGLYPPKKAKKSRKNSSQDIEITRRALEILQLRQQGKTTKEISETLGISHAWTRNSLSNTYRILESRNSREAINKAVELGLLDPLTGL